MLLQIKIPGTYRKKGSPLLIDDFKGASNTLVDEARLPGKFAKESVNLIQVQDGLWKTRWGTGFYGNAISGEGSIDGAAEYVKSDGTREIVAIGGTTGTFYKSSNNGSSWTAVSGATFTAGNQPFFLQISEKLYIANGTDSLTIYNGTSLTRYTQLSAPTGLTLTRGSGLAAGSYNLYYQVTALNDVGETVGSTESTITVNKTRNTWSGSTENVVLNWTAVTGATRYQVYYSDESGKEVLIDSTPTNSYTDDGTKEPNPYVLVPLDNTTGAPLFRQMELSGNRIWATGDTVNKYRVYFSGVGQYLGYFSSFYGGGWVDIERGGRDTPIGVVHYRTGKGDSVATVLCSSPEGRGSIWQISLESITVGSTTFVVPVPIKVVGSIGTNSAIGIVKAGDNIFFPNKRGIFALRNKAQLFNVLATDELSQGIRPSYRSLQGTSIEKIAAYYFDGKVFFSLPIGSSDNDRIIIYDLERNNWNWYWDFGVKQFFEYTDSSDTSHFLAVPTSGGQLWEISENFANDRGSKFNTSYISPLLSVSKKKTEFAKITDVYFELGRPRGVINVEVLGIEKKRGFTSVASKTITDTVSNIDFANNLWGDYEFSSDEDEAPKTFSSASIKKRVRVNKLLNAIQFKVASNTADTEYTLLSIQAEGEIIPTRPPSVWN